jgi:hypothetical protein
MILASIFTFAVTASATVTPIFVPPDAHQTPGFLCTAKDSNFKDFEYPEHIARCNRNIGTAEKSQVAAAYGGIPQQNWSQYEFDHYYPLCAGGSNDARNLWPQVLDEAHKKDIVENQVCLEMKAGTMTQVQGMQKIRDWFTQAVAEAAMPPNPEASSNGVTCRDKYGVVVHFDLVGGGNSIAHARIAVLSENGENEAVRMAGPLSARLVSGSKSRILDGMSGYSLNAKGDDDEFTLYLPSRVTRSDSEFAGYLKVRFEDNYPRLSVLDCIQ